MFDFLDAREKMAALLNGLLTIFSPTFGLIVFVAMFIFGMVRGGDYSWAKGTGVGFLLGIVVSFVLALIGIGLILAIDPIVASE